MHEDGAGVVCSMEPAHGQASVAGAPLPGLAAGVFILPIPYTHTPTYDIRLVL